MIAYIHQFVFASPPSIGDLLPGLFHAGSSIQMWLFNNFTLLGNTFSTLSFEILAATGIAAFGGAYGAQFIAERNRRREYFYRQLRLCNAAIGIACDICNYSTEFKKTFVIPVKSNFDEEAERFRIFQISKSLGLNKSETLYEFGLDFRQMTQPLLDTQGLEALIFEELDVHGSPVVLVSALRRSIKLLSETVVLRNEFIRNNYNSQSAVSAYEYFGTWDEFGNVDERYINYIESIEALTDNCIFFSKSLCRTLHSFGLQKRKQGNMKKRKIMNIDFTIAEEQGLHPDPKKFEGWEMFERFDD